MVSAAHFYATVADQQLLLDYLGEPHDASLHPWPVVCASSVALSRAEALSRDHVTVVSGALGGPVLIGPGSASMGEPTRAGVFNRINWERLAPQPDAGLVDSNVSPVLLWTPATHVDGDLRAGSIGSQADAPRSVSTEYERWVNRVMGWVRRRGTRVWGLEAARVRPDLDIRRSDVTTVVALPEALAALEAGAVGL